MAANVDFIVIGGGIAGAAAADALAALGTVLLVEMEAQPGHHTTGRSAALFTPHYGPAPVQAINRHSLRFYLNPPDGFAERPLLTRRGMLTVAGPDEGAALDEVRSIADGNPAFRAVDAAEIAAMAPVLRPMTAHGGYYEADVWDMDVALIHQGFLKRMKARGGRLHLDAPVTAIARTDGGWTVQAGGETWQAGIVVNAAGAWADEVAKLAGVRPLGLVPKRRTAITIDGPAGLDLSRQPMIEIAATGMYMRPEGGRLMVSPADETPMPPHDVQPDDFEVAVMIDALAERTLVSPRRPASSWAGLRCFFADNLPALGDDPSANGFHWFAGLGGYGIMMSPALGEAVASLVAAGRLPDGLVAEGLTPAMLSPARLRN